MAFTSAITDSTIVGNKKKSWGTYASSGGGTGGDVSTGLRVCETFELKPLGSAVATNASVINETFPVVRVAGAASAAITIVTDANQTGTWEAMGR